MKRLLTGALVAAVPVALAAALCLWLMQGRMLPLGGDEPHYLVMADSLVRDRDLQLRNNYEEDFRTKRIYGPVQPHAFQYDRGWFPYHTPGMSALVAVPFALGGALGARLGLVLFAGLLPLALYVWLSGRLPRGTAAWLTLGATVSLPLVWGAVAIYPDLPGGVLALVASLWLVSRGERTVTRPTPGYWVAWAAFWLVSGFLPWLNIKFIVTTAALAAGGLWLARRDGPAGRRTALLAGPLVLVGPILLALFHVWAFGSLLGGRGSSEVTDAPLRALMIFLGLHLDQANGMFLQQPLFLAGVPALAILARRDWRLALVLAGLYASLILPNAFQMARFGGGGPSGRFGWSAAWLWMIPIGLAVADRRDRLERFVRPMVLLALAYQVALALRWVPDPGVLMPELDERIWARNSLFPPDLRYVVPSFYFWDFRSYLSYTPNVLAAIGVVLLACSGAAWRSVTRRSWVRPAWVAYAVLCGILLPVAPIGGTIEQAQRERGLVRAAASQITRRFEAERLSPRSLGGTSREDPQASQGEARANRPARPDNFIIFGPWLDLAAGRYHAELAIRLGSPTSAKIVGFFEVTANRGRQVVARQAVEAAALVEDAYRLIRLDFEVEEPLGEVEFRFITERDVDVLLDYVELTPVLPHPPEQ